MSINMHSYIAIYTSARGFCGLTRNYGLTWVNPPKLRRATVERC